MRLAEKHYHENCSVIGLEKVLQERFLVLSSFFDRIRRKRTGPTSPQSNQGEKASFGQNAYSESRGFTNFHSSAHWNLWATAEWLSNFSSSITEDILSFPELFVDQIEEDFGYSIFPPTPGGCYDGKRMDLVLDPASQGGAHTGSIFGPVGVSLSPDSVYNEYNGEVGFWFKLLALHETINVWTGALASGWVWADGSPLWKGTSPFPNMADIVILKEIGNNRSSRLQEDRMRGDSYVALFLNIQRNFEWRPFHTLFSLVRDSRIHDFHKFDEPLRTAIVVLFLGRGAKTNLLEQFQRAGINVTDEAYNEANSMFPEFA